MKRKAINETARRMGRALFAARQTARMTHADAADILGITTDDLLEYERGSVQIPIEVLQHLFTTGYKMIGIRKLEKKYLAQRNFIRKLKQAIKEGS